MEKREETFVYEGLGFPIQLIDAPMKKVFGEWIIDVDMIALQKFVFKDLMHKSYSLTGKQIRFMRKFLEISTIELGRKLGVPRAAVVKWERGLAKMSLSQQSRIRLVFMEHFTDKFAGSY